MQLLEEGNNDSSRSGKVARLMTRYLRPLAIAVVIIEVFTAICTISVLNAGLFGRVRLLIDLATNPLSI